MNLFNKESFARNAVFQAAEAFIEGNGFDKESIAKRLSDIMVAKGVTDVFQLLNLTLIGPTELIGTMRTSYSEITLKIKKDYKTDAFSFELLYLDSGKLQQMGQFIDIVQQQAVD